MFPYGILVFFKYNLENCNLIWNQIYILIVDQSSNLCPDRHSVFHLGLFYLRPLGVGRMEKIVNLPYIFEPTCAYCAMGSYASLSVCPSVTLDNNSYLKKYLTTL